MRSEILYTGRRGIRMVAAGSVVRYKIDYHFKTGVMSASNKLLEFTHTVIDIHSQIRVNVIIILYSIWRTCLSFHNMRIIGRDNALVGVVGLGCMLYDTCIPYSCDPQFLDTGKHLVGDFVHLPHPILSYCSVRDTFFSSIGKQTWEHLIYDRFSVHFS